MARGVRKLLQRVIVSPASVFLMRLVVKYAVTLTRPTNADSEAVRKHIRYCLLVKCAILHYPNTMNRPLAVCTANPVHKPVNLALSISTSGIHKSVSGSTCTCLST